VCVCDQVITSKTKRSLVWILDTPVLTDIVRFEVWVHRSHFTVTGGKMLLKLLTLIDFNSI